MRTHARNWIRLILGFAGALLLTTRAEAHLVSTGAGSFYDGIGHFFLSPDDVIPVVAFALLVGMRGMEVDALTLWTLPVAWFAGGAIGLLSGLPILSGQAPAAASFLVLGILVASDLRLPKIILPLLALLLGTSHGFFNGLAMREAGFDKGLLQLGGIGLMIFLLVLHGGELVRKIKWPWARIVVRVAGSWIAASGLLLLGWSLRTR